MNKTTTIYSIDEVRMMQPKDRPMCYRVPSGIYHAVFEAVGAASLCWEPKPTGVFAVEQAEKFAVELLFKIAEVLEQMDMTYGEWPDSFKSQNETPKTEPQ